MAPIVPAGQLLVGLQLPVQAQSSYFVEEWERQAGPAEMLDVAQAAEGAGFGYVAVCDHVAIPAELAPRMSAVWWDTVATLSWVAGQTSRIRLLSSVYNLGYRHPLVAAKAFATLDVLSAGRLVIGVGAGHVQREFAALGIDYTRRGRLLDEHLARLDALLRTGQEDGMLVHPLPVQRPRPPIWVGGSAPAAIRRAARLADGWLPQGTPLEQLPAAVALFRSERGDDGGDLGAITEWLYLGSPSWDVGRPCVSGDAERVVSALRRWTAAGANHLQVRFPSRSAAELTDQLAAFGAEVLPALR